MKLLVQGDDYGFTKAVTLGIIEGIDNGILRNTGMFTNMSSAVLAAELMKDRPQACFGIDFNLVSGNPVSDPATVPHLVDENGEFIRSTVRVKDPRFQSEAGRREMFPAEEVNREIRAQYDRFIELTGIQPGYLHGHSISSEPYDEAIFALSKETGVPYSFEILKQCGVIGLKYDPKAPVKKEFDPMTQLNKDTLGMILEQSEHLLSAEYAMIIGHPGYIDAELLGLTTLSLERCKDLAMITSDKIKQWVKDNNIELITYADLVKLQK